MIILGIETSCDETALALIETRWTSAAGEGQTSLECRVIDSLVHSQAELHSAYGGVFPTLAKREHGKNIIPLFHKLMTQAHEALDEVAHADHSKKAEDEKASTNAIVSEEHWNATIDTFKKELDGQNPELVESLARAQFLKNIPPIDRIAVTEGPGLEPALWVGIAFSRLLGALWGVPIVPVNHMEGHIVGSLLPDDRPYGVWNKLYPIAFPALALLISGGHTELVKLSGIGMDRDTSNGDAKNYEIIGETKDDAVGEAFDKAARLLGLPYPGGPHLARLAHEAYEQGIQSPIKLPRPMLDSGDLNFSFSGLKTAVLYAIRDYGKKNGIVENIVLDDTFKKGLAREFEQAAADTLDSKLRTAIEEVGAKAVIIGGGVSANHVLRARFTATAAEYGIPLFLPSAHISGDNALMIAIAGAYQKAPDGRVLMAHGTKRLA